MTEEQLADFKKRLEARLDDVSGRLAEQESVLHAPSDNRDFVGADRAQELETQEADSAIVESEENFAKKIQHALDRIKEGTYGICEDCACEIPMARLEAKPSVSLCVPCQEKHEAS